jgi:hypothetical protein
MRSTRRVGETAIKFFYRGRRKAIKISYSLIRKSGEQQKSLPLGGRLLFPDSCSEKNGRKLMDRFYSMVASGGKSMTFFL